jgi:hypothetical protein
MVLYTPQPANVIQCCVVIAEVRESENESVGLAQGSSERAGKQHQKAHSKSRKSSQKASGSSVERKEGRPAREVVVGGKERQSKEFE